MIVTGEKLNFACGETRWPGFVNSDIADTDFYVDLEDHPYPYGDETAEIVMISHGLAMGDGNRAVHPNLEPIMWEFHRILIPGGWLRIDDNPFRIIRQDEALPETEVTSEAGRGFPAELRSDRDELIAILDELGFAVSEIDPDTTLIPCDDETRAAIVGNHEGHFSFTLEAQKC